MIVSGSTRPPFLELHEKIFQALHLFNDMISAADQTKINNVFPHTNSFSKRVLSLDCLNYKYAVINGLYTKPTFTLSPRVHIIEFRRYFKISLGYSFSVALEVFTYLLNSDKLIYQKQSVNSFFPSSDYEWLGTDTYDMFQKSDLEKIISDVQSQIIQLL